MIDFSLSGLLTFSGALNYEVIFQSILSFEESELPS